MKGVVAAVVTVAFNRPDYLQRHIASVLSVHGSDPANRHLLLHQVLVAMTDPLLQYHYRSFRTITLPCHEALSPSTHLDGWIQCSGRWLVRRSKFPLFISQDGTPVHEATQQQAQSYEAVGIYSR